MSGEVSECPICQKPASRMCSGCHSVFYCSAEHQKEDWKTHKTNCRPYIIKRNELYGRYCVAARDLPQGTIIMSEGPLVVGPKRSSFPICLGCHKRVDGSYRCSKCTFPLCGPECEEKKQHSEYECPVFQRGYPIGSRITDFTKMHPAYEAVTPLRCLLLRDKYSSKWEKLLTMEHHNEMRKTLYPEMWNQNSINTVKLLREFLKLKDQFDADIIHSCMGYIDVNSFEIKTKNIEICGLYPEAGLMCHDCTPNTHHATTINGPSFQMIIRTSIPIKKGEIITTSYVDALKGTLERREFLKSTKFFDCLCKRCKDPTEFFSYFSAVKCPQCPNYFLPEDPLNYELNSIWRCGGGDKVLNNAKICEKALTYEKIQSILQKVGKEIEIAESSTSGSSISRFERVLKKFSGKVLHPNHFLLVGLIRPLSQMYLQGCSFQVSENGEFIFDGVFEKDVLKRKRELCLEFLEILDLIDPGLARNRGVTLYHLYKCEFPLFKARYDAKEITKEEYKEKLTSILAYLETGKETLELDRLLIDNPVLPLAVDVAVDNICLAISNLK